MSAFFHKGLLTLILLLLGCFHAMAQNMISNPDFEIYTACPYDNPPQGTLYLCPPWQIVPPGSSDYFNVCATLPMFSVPDNFAGYEYANSGVAYGGGAFLTSPSFYREYIVAPLKCPMLPGALYYFSMHVSVGDETCGIDKIGVHFSDTIPTYTGMYVDLDPSIEFSFAFITWPDGWVSMGGWYQATGGEKFATIGNFYSNAETTIDPLCQLGYEFAYYYVDDVELYAEIPPDPIIFDLGPPVITCHHFEIDPDITGVNYLWEDGSDDSTHMVSASGMYYLTVSMGCREGYDSIYVEILGADDPVDLGPNQDTICTGEVYTISLDPDAGQYTWSNGATGPEINIITPGYYSVTLNDDDCDVTSDNIFITLLNAPPPFSLGPDDILCSGDVIYYDFDPAIGDFAWSDGSTSPEYTIESGGIYSLTISNICGLASDQIELQDLEAPDIEFDPYQLDLCEGDTLTINLDPSLGQYIWQDFSPDTNYAITEPGSYSVTVVNACGSDYANLSVASIPKPTPELGPDTVVCAGQLPILLDAGNSGGNSFLWQDGSTGSQYSVMSAGVYGVTVSNICTSVSDQILVQVQDSLLHVQLPQDQSLCEGQTFVLVNTGASGNHQWQDNSAADTLLVTDPGTYSLTVTTACGIGSDTVNVDYFPPLQIPDLGPDLSLCPGEQLVLAPEIAGVDYLWHNGSTADTFVVTGAGTYYVQVADQCSIALDTIQVVLNTDPPDIELPPALSLCQGTNLTLDPGISGVSYLWNNGSTSSTIIVSSPGIYSLTVSNSCGMDSGAVVITDAGPAPQVSLGNDMSLCPGDLITLSPSSSHVNSWLWHDGSNDSSYILSEEGIITVEVSNSCGNSYDTLIATLLPPVPPVDLGMDTSLCPGASLNLMLNIPDVLIEWSDGYVGSEFFINEAGSYYVTISNACGENADTIDVGLLPGAPVADLGMDQSLCPGEVIILDPGVGDATYLWQDGSTSTTYHAYQAGTIVLQLSNACGTDQDTLEITVSNNSPQVDLGPDVLACEGDIVPLIPDISGVNYLWQDGSTEPEFSASLSGVYYLQVSNNCGVDSDTVVVDIHGTTPNTDLGRDTLMCTGDALVLSSDPDPGTVIQWQDGSAQPTFTITLPGIYFLSETNHCGVNNDTIVVEFLEQPLPFSLGPDTTLCPGESLVLTAPSTNYSIQWQDGSSAPDFLANQPQTYSLELSNECGTAYDELILAYKDDCLDVDWFVPNVFSPNGDQINDIFSFQFNPGAEIKSVIGDIFDRWGNHLYHSAKRNFSWDGKCNGQPVNPGVYIYKFTVVYMDDGYEVAEEVVGDVTLIK